MPTYDYKCTQCGHRWELFQSMTAKHVKVCPSCGKKAAERQIGIGAAVLFKGSGFYQTDYRTESYAKGAEAEKKASEAASSPGPEAAKTEPPSGTKTDKKAESSATSAVTSEPAAKVPPAKSGKIAPKKKR